MNKIVIVDDDNQILLMLKKILEKKYLPFICSDPLQAFSMVIEQNPSLVILDIQMPKMDGLEFCSLMRNGEFTKDIPILIISGKMEEFEEEKLKPLFESERIDYLIKPFGLNELLDKIQTLL